MTTSRSNTIMSWMAYTEFFYPGCELQPGNFYNSIPELFYFTPEDGACIGAAGIDAYPSFVSLRSQYSESEGGFGRILGDILHIQFICITSKPSYFLNIS